MKSFLIGAALAVAMPALAQTGSMSAAPPAGEAMQAPTTDGTMSAPPSPGAPDGAMAPTTATSAMPTSASGAASAAGYTPQPTSENLPWCSRKVTDRCKQRNG